MFSGTGAHGAYQAGVLRALHESGARIDVVAGHGVGAATAVLAAIDGGAKLWEQGGLWSSTRIPSYYRWRWPFRVATVMLTLLALAGLVPAAVALGGALAYGLAFLVSLVGGGAGTTLAELDAATARHNQWCPLLPWGDDSATVGATFATATSGPCAAALGRPRDIAVGVQFVDGTGMIVRGGGRVVKNVAGYDVSRAVAGWAGGLGVEQMGYAAFFFLTFWLSFPAYGLLPAVRAARLPTTTSSRTSTSSRPTGSSWSTRTRSSGNPTS